MAASAIATLSVVLWCVAPISSASGSSGGPQAIAKCPVKPGSTSGDFEVVFGRRRIRARAQALLRKVHAKGFRRAIIEREACTFEVAIVFLTKRQAQKFARNARRKGFRVVIMRS